MISIVHIDRKPIESTKYPGYFILPGFPMYVIREDGDLINTLTGNHIKQSIGASGYASYHSIIDEYGKKRSVLVSRMLKITFDPVENMENLFVDHINNNTRDNRLCNLNWTDNQGNISKAGKDGLLARHRHVLIKNWSTGEVKEFPSLAAVGRFVGLSADKIRYRIKCHDGRVFPEGYQYKYKDDVMDWAEFEEYQIEEEHIRYGHERKVMLRDLISGNVYHYDTLKDAAKAMNIPASSLSNYIDRSSDLQPVLPGLIQLKYENDLREWIDYEDPYLELAKSIGDRLIQVTNASTGEWYIFVNQLDCCRSMGINPTALNNRLKMYEPGHVFRDGYIVGYYPDESVKMKKAQRPSVWSRDRRLPEMPSTLPGNAGGKDMV